MKNIFYLFINIILLTNSFIYSVEAKKIQVEYGVNGEIKLIVDSLVHFNYGLAHPLTYKFEYADTNQDLFALKRIGKNGNWIELNTKTKNDFFNGIEAARFEYDSNSVFISVAFASSADTLYLKVVNSLGNNLLLNYKGISKYYDDRKAVVTTTADDLIHHTTGFIKAFRAFRSRNLWLSCGAVTGYMYERQWNDLQQEVDSGYVEIDSHSSTHQPAPYADVNFQVVGSKEDIINNLNLPPLYKNGDKEYVYSYIYPFGGWGDPIDSTAGQNGYLINRTVVPGEYDFTDWNNHYNMFNRVGVVYEIGGSYDSFSGVSNLPILNFTFDQIVQQGRIYHFSIHPNDIEEVGDWEKPYMSEHLDYIANRKNIWYVGFGHLYLYHYLQINDSLPRYSNLNLKVFLQGAYFNSEQMNDYLNDNLNQNQPYNTEPWSYGGDESFNTIPSDNIVSWVLVSLKSNPNDTSYVSRRAALLKSNGSIVDIDGSSLLRFNVNPGDYYVIIQHSNHLAVMSSIQVHIE